MPTLHLGQLHHLFWGGHDTEYLYIVGLKFGNNLHKEWYLNVTFVEVQNVAINRGDLFDH